MNIVILSRSAYLYSTSRLVSEAKLKGHRVIVVDSLECELVIKDNKPQIYYEGRYLKNIDAIIPRVGASTTYHGCAVLRHFEMMGVKTTVSSEAILKSRDKFMSAQYLSAQGIAMPNTVFGHHSTDSRSLIKRVGGAPVIIKVTEGTQGLGVVLANDTNTAESVLEAFNDVETKVLLQDFVKESKGADIRALIVGGKVVGAMKRQAENGEFRSNLHRGGSAKVVSLSPEEKLLAESAAKALDIPVCGVDMLQSKNGPLLLEINSTPGLEGIEKATTKNIAGEIISYLESQIK